MPSTSPKQARTMAAAAHNPSFAKRVGIPSSVAKDFNRADTGGPMLKGSRPKNASYAAGGPVTGRTRDFMKEPDAFRTGKGPGAEQDYGTKEKSKPADKSLTPVKPR